MIATQGIEYGDMQLIAEAYDILKRGLGLPEDEIADIFERWNKGVLDSFLIEITCNILRFKDDDGEALVTKILDQAGQKGTGKWTAVNALDAGIPGINALNRLFSHADKLVQSRLLVRPYLPARYLPSKPSVPAQAGLLLAPRRRHSAATKNSLSMTWSRLYMPPRSFLTHKASCSCVRLPES
jgi:hypothetical protein